MKDIEIALKSVRNIAYGLIIEGIGAVALGILIFVWPDLVGIFLGAFFLASGIVALVLGVKVHRYSKFKIEL